MTTEPEILAFAERYFDAIFTGDIETLRTLYTPDAVIWHNHDGREMSVEENLAVVQWFATTLPDQRCQVVRREALKDGFLQQDLLTATLPDGTPFSHTACVVVTLRGGLVARVDEYIDSAEMQPLIALHASQRAAD